VSKTGADTLAVALAYAGRGWSVVPLVAHGKRPLVRWAPYQRQPADPARIRAWFQDNPDANLGIVTGAVSGLMVLDIDPQHDGDDSLSDLEHRHGPLPETIEALTGGGGRHIYFRHPGGSVRNLVGLVPGIDLRADGGLVVAPPSVHPSGRRYAWEVSHHPDDTDLAAPPGWLLRLIRETAGTAGHPLAHWRGLVKAGVAEGERNSTVASFAGHLLWHGVDPEVVLDLLLCWNATRCRPPLSDDEVARTVDSIARLHARSHPDSDVP
jgi:hypothetical protein